MTDLHIISVVGGIAAMAAAAHYDGRHEAKRALLDAAVMLLVVWAGVNGVHWLVAHVGVWV